MRCEQEGEKVVGALCVCMALFGWLSFGIPPDRLKNVGVGRLVAVF